VIILELQTSDGFPIRAGEYLRAPDVSWRMSSLLTSPYLEAPQAVTVGPRFEESGVGVRYETSMWRVTELDFYVALHRLNPAAAEGVCASCQDGVSTLEWPRLGEVDTDILTEALQFAIAGAIMRSAGPLCTNDAISRWKAEARSADLPELARLADAVVPALVNRGVNPPHPSTLGSIHTGRMSTCGAIEWAYALVRERPILKVLVPPTPSPTGSTPEATHASGPLTVDIETSISEQLGFSPRIELEPDHTLPPQVLALRLNRNIRYHHLSTRETWRPQEAAVEASIQLTRLRPDVLFTIEDAAGLLAEVGRSHPSLVRTVLQLHSLVELTDTLRPLLQLHESLRRLVPLLEDILARQPTRRADSTADRQ
jgi:hypothetical protein